MEVISRQDILTCPCCNSTERFFENLLREMKKNAFLPDNIAHFDFQVREGVPLPSQKINTAPGGTVFLFFRAIWDICSKCGCMYSILTIEAAVKKSLNIPRLLTPGGADLPSVAGFTLT